MTLRHDYVTPYIDGIRFFDKPPLLYWLAAGSMRVFGETDWAARLPLALITLALLLATYALGLRLFASVSPAAAPDRAALYGALALATCIGPYLYTRFYIPDIALTLWMTLAVHLVLLAFDRLKQQRSTLLPMLGFGAVLALSALTKGFIGVLFPVTFVLLFAALTHRLRQLRRLHVPASSALFLALAAPWHILAALRNPAIPMPSGQGLPARAGWAWFYLYNEHIARFFSRRIPHDYGQVPIPLFWLLCAVWLVPWAAFLPGAVLEQLRALRRSATSHARETALALLLWAALVLGFFTLSARQEYYSLPCVPAFALAIGALLARADRASARSSLRLPAPPSPEDTLAGRSALRCSLWLLLPFGAIAASVAIFFAITAPIPRPGTDVSALLTASGGSYNLSLDHLFDLTTTAMGLFRGPLLLFAASMVGIGPASYLLRRARHTRAATLMLAASAVTLLLSMHQGLVRFYPVLGSKALAAAIVASQQANPRANDLLVIDGELTAGSTLLFYTRQSVSLLDGRVNGPWFGSFWPGSPAVFETPATFDTAWAGPRRIYLLTYHPRQRASELCAFGPVMLLATSGGKAILTNRP